MSLYEISHRAKLDRAQVRPLLRHLMDEGLVVVKGKTRGARYQRVATATIEMATFPLPKEIGNYFCIGTEFKTVADHFQGDNARDVSTTIWRLVSVLKVHGLLEVRMGKGHTNGKRSEEVRRKFRSVTFRDDGTVVFS